MSGDLIKTAEFLCGEGWALTVGFGEAMPLDAATTDVARIIESLEWASSAQLYVATGSRSGIIALEILDSTGPVTLANLDRAASGLPSSLGYRTARGEVVLFKLPPAYLVESASMGIGLKVVGENGLLAVPALSGTCGNDWTFPPTYCELEWPPAWLFELLDVRRTQLDADDTGMALAAVLFNASVEHGARREDALFEAASRFAPLYAGGLVTLVEVQTQLLAAAEANGLSHTHRWFELEPLLLSEVKAALRSEGTV